MRASRRGRDRIIGVTAAAMAAVRGRAVLAVSVAVSLSVGVMGSIALVSEAGARPSLSGDPGLIVGHSPSGHRPVGVRVPRHTARGLRRRRLFYARELAAHSGRPRWWRVEGKGLSPVRVVRSPRLWGAVQTTDGQRRVVRAGMSADPSFPSGLFVSVGYADSLRPNGFFPSPWAGSSGVTFEGCQPVSSCQFDGGAIELVNTSSSPITVGSVSVQLNASGDTTSCVVNIWPSNVTIPASGTAIYAQTVSGAGNGCPSGGSFDTSDVGPNGSNWSGNCSQSGVVPQVTVAANGASATFTDFQQILNTGGIDLASCPSGTNNESRQWTELGSGMQATTGNGGGSPLVAQIATTCAGRPVNCATGDFWHTFDLLSVPGRGVPLDLSLTYNSLSASQASAFGLGWSSPYGMSLQVNAQAGTATVVQENGATGQFTLQNGAWQAPSWEMGSLTQNADGTFTFFRRHDHRSFLFSASGQLQSITDRNGYVTRLAYNLLGQLTTVTDPAGRTLTFIYGPTGDVSQVVDPAGRSVSFGYDLTGQLTSITEANGGVWSLGYGSGHLLTSMTDPRNDGSLTNTYDSQGRVTQQTDPMGRITKLSYLAGVTTITDPNGNVTEESFSALAPTTAIRAVGTSSEATSKYANDPATFAPAQVTDPNGNTTYYTTDAFGNVTGTNDMLGETTSASYNGFDEPISVTDQNGVTTSFSYDANGNRLSVSRPLTATGQTRTTTYSYGDASHPGDVTAITDPNGNQTTFTYDAYGDQASSTDAKGDETTDSYVCSGAPTQGCYSNIGLLYSEVSPRGNASGGNPASFTTSYTYNALREPLTIVDPLGHTTSYQYDADGNKTQMQDPDGNKTGYAYDADNEVTQVNRADGTTQKTGYDGDGNVTSQTDGANQATGYSYSPINEVTSVADPLGRKTSYSYDLAGRLTSVVDPLSRTTSYGYDAVDRLTSITYSDGKTPNASFGYYPNGQRKSMTDGTGTTSYSYDSLDRLTSQSNGDNQTVGYGYDLFGNLTSITYPNGKTVTRGYDSAERLQSITDWLGNKTALGYDPDSNQTATTFPSSTGNVDSYAYDNADQLTQIGTTQGSTTLANFGYTRDANGQLGSVTPTGVNQGNETYSYTPLNQLKSVNGIAYGYDAADNPTQLGPVTLSYDGGNQIKALTSGGQTTNFSYDALGERTQGGSRPAATSSYTYDQAQRLTQVQRSSASGTLAGGENHSLAVKSDGSVWAWGDNTYGQLGTGTTTSSTTPVQVSGLSGATAVAAGDISSAALKSDGSVRTWGYNGDGELGNGTTTSTSSPVQVSGLSGVTQLAAGNYHVLALKSDGTVVAWGFNYAGELGDGTTTSRTAPVAVNGLAGVVQVAAGGLPCCAGHSVALKADGTVWTWGYNKHGQLGIGVTGSVITTPTEVSGLSGVIQIAANGDNTYALKSDGTVWAWGDDSYGQLGNPSASHIQWTPIQVNITGAVAIGAGATAAFAIKADGSVWSWGDNNTGQLGDGGSCGKTCVTPVQASGLSNATEVTGGYVHSLAAVTNGTAWAWGENTYGQLGNGTTTVAFKPVQVSNLTGVAATGTGLSITYTYDGDGLRASSTLAGQTQHYAWDLTATNPLLLTDGTTNYIYDDNGLPVEQVAGNGTVLYYHHDQLGSTRLLTDANGAMAASYTFDANGNLTSQTGSTDTRLRWAGEYQDATGLYYLSARYYDPITSQFLTRDPIDAVTRETYDYASNDPLNKTDASGDGTGGCIAKCIAKYFGDVFNTCWGTCRACETDRPGRNQLYDCADCVACNDYASEKDMPKFFICVLSCLTKQEKTRSFKKSFKKLEAEYEGLEAELGPPPPPPGPSCH